MFEERNSSENELSNVVSLAHVNTLGNWVFVACLLPKLFGAANVWMVKSALRIIAHNKSTSNILGEFW